MGPGLALLALGFVSVVWAGGYIAASVAVSPAGGFGPLWLTAIRLVLAGSMLAALARWRGVAQPPSAALAPVILGGAVAWMGGSGLATLGQVSVPAGTTTLVLGTAPLGAVALEAGLARRWPSLRACACLALGLLGLALAVGPRLEAAPLGLLLVGGGALAWAASGVLEARRPEAHGHPLAIAAWQMGTAGLGMALLAVLAGEALPAPTLAGSLGFGWLTVACAVIGVPVWLAVLRTLPLSVAMAQATLTPVVALGLDAALLGERVPPLGLAGAALVLLAAAASARVAG